MKVLLLFIGVAFCMAAENLRLKKTNTALRQALASLQKSAEEDVAELGAGHDWRTNQQFSHVTYTGNERPRGPKMSHEKAVARSSRDSCLSGCQRLGAKDYAACEMRCRLETAVGSDSKWETMEEKGSYGLGLQTGQGLVKSRLEGINVDAIADGIADALYGDMPKVEIDEINNALDEMYYRAETRRQEDGRTLAADGEAFLKDNALRPEVTVLESGLQYEILTEGTGEIPTISSQVRVDYTGELTDGTVFDSSIIRGQPAEFPVTGVIKGWTEALQLMPVGSTWKLYIPQDLAYGEKGVAPTIPPFAALVFEVQLLDIL